MQHRMDLHRILDLTKSAPAAAEPEDEHASDIEHGEKQVDALGTGKRKQSVIQKMSPDQLADDSAETGSDSVIDRDADPAQF